MSAATPPTGPTDLIVTKLLPPRAGKAQIVRKGLLKQLESASHQALVLLTAPAGFGKSTLLRQWRQILLAEGATVAWLNVDPEDDESSRFKAYVVASLARADPDLLASTTARPRKDVSEGSESLLSALIADLHRASKPVWLMLDSFEAIRSPEIHAWLADLLRFAPENLHLAIAARSLPELPKAELAARDQMTVLRTEDLAMTLAETRELVGQRASVPVEAGITGRLHEATQGWPAGIRLALMALETGIDLDAYLVKAGGLRRDAAPLLLESVMSALPPEDLDLMLRLSITRRFNESLCTALAGAPIAQRDLERLRARQPFMQRTEEWGDWYEFHALFRDWLDARREQQAPQLAPELHRRAAAWFSRHGYPLEALHHSLACGGVEVDPRLVLSALAIAIGGRGVPSIAHVLFNEVPKDVLLRFPNVRLHMAFGLVLCKQFEAAREMLAGLDDTALDYPWREGKLVVEVAMLMTRDSAAEALARMNEWPASVLDPAFPYYKLACLMAGIACLNQGEFERARELFLRVTSTEARPPEYAVHVACMAFQGMLRERQGEIALALHAFEKALSDARSRVSGKSLCMVLVSCGMAGIAYEQGLFDRVDELISPRLALIREYSAPRMVFRAYLALARVSESRGDAAYASDLLDELEGLAVAGGFDWLRAAAIGERIRMQLRRRATMDISVLLRQLESLTGSARPGPQAPANDIAGIAAVARARYDLARGRAERAEQQFRSLAEAAELSGEAYAAVRSRVMQSCACLAAGREQEAARILAGAMAIGERFGMFRVFVDEADVGPLLDVILRSADLQERPSAAFVQRIATALESPVGDAPQARPAAAAAGVRPELLSAREREVLDLLARGLPNRSIAGALEVSIDTVKYHLKNIFDKLGVRSRRAAIDEARRQGLIERPQGR